MKKLLCILLVACLFPVCAFALDLDAFNTYASIFGAKELDKSSSLSASGMTIFTIKNGRISFTEEGGKIKRVFIEGNGIDFLAYSMTAIMLFDPSSDNYAANAGQLLSAFLLCRTQSESYGQIAAGNVFIIQAQDGGYVFTIGK